MQFDTTSGSGKSTIHVMGVLLPPLETLKSRTNSPLALVNTTVALTFPHRKNCHEKTDLPSEVVPIVHLGTPAVQHAFAVSFSTKLFSPINSATIHTAAHIFKRLLRVEKPPR